MWVLEYKIVREGGGTFALCVVLAIVLFVAYALWFGTSCLA